jgi:type I restriction enzyme S subunit
MPNADTPATFTTTADLPRSLPDGWRWARLGDVCEFKYGNGLPSHSRVEGTIPVYGSNGIVGYHNKSLTAGPTIVVGRKGSIGEVHLSETGCWPIDTTYYVDQTYIEIDLTWLARTLSSLPLRGLNKAAAVPGLNRDDAYALSIPLPPLAEQCRIAAILAERMAAVERARAAAEAQLAAINALPAALLRQAFNGEL